MTTAEALRALQRRLSDELERGELDLPPADIALLFFSVGAAYAASSAPLWGRRSHCLGRTAEDMSAHEFDPSTEEPSA